MLVDLLRKFKMGKYIDGGGLVGGLGCLGGGLLHTGVHSALRIDSGGEEHEE